MDQTAPPGDGDRVEYCMRDSARPPGVVVGSVQLGRVWVKPEDGGPKWSAKITDIRILDRHQSPPLPSGW